MKKIAAIFKKHIFLTILGSLSILISTYIIGIKAYSLEIDLSEKQEILNNINEKINNANYAHDKSNINYNFAHLLRTIIKVSIVQDRSVQEAYEKVYRASIFPMLLELYEASGYILNNEQLKELKTKCDLAFQGDDKILNELLETSATLLEKSGIYRGDLIIKKAEIKNSIEIVERDIIRTKYHAIVLQILGLLFFLIRDMGKENKK